MNLKEFTQETFSEERFSRRPRITCNDGFNMSVQGGEGIYSNPRSNSLSFASMEIGFPSEEVNILNEYAEDDSDYTNTVYGYVPCDIIQKVIDLHGGINIDSTIKI